MIDSIEFSSLKPYKTDQRKSFELLCYIIAKAKYENKGVFTPVDDSGGGDGVEFYLTLPNSGVWGWQAKFYLDHDRLNVGGRNKQIEKSLKRSCEIHPDLKKWYLCTANKFTPTEKKWFENELPKVIPAKIRKGVKIIHWSNDDIIGFLAKPECTGISHYFFGALELDIEWFKKRFQENFESVKNKYDPDVHTSDKYIYSKLNKALMNDSYLSDWGTFLDSLKEMEVEFLKHSEVLINKQFLTGEVKNICLAYKDLVRKFQLSVTELYKKLNEIESFIQRKNNDQLNKFDFKSIIRQTKETQEELIISSRKWGKDAPREIGISIDAIATFTYRFETYFEEQFDFNTKDFAIVGGANLGKTHLACDFSKNIIDKQLPLIFIPASRFSDRHDIEQSMKEILDIPSEHSFEDFLDAIDICAEVFNSRVPILIEGLNETTFENKGFSNIWTNNFSSFRHKVLSKKNIILITTCRPGYAEKIFGEHEKKNFLNIWGLSNPVDAINKYFKKYKIKADFSFASIEHFHNPIYLKLFCEIKNPNAQNTREIEVIVGQENLIEIFDGYLDRINKDIVKRLELRRGEQVVKPNLLKVAKYLWFQNIRSIPIEEFNKIVDADYTAKGYYNSKELLNEGLLFIPEWEQNGEVVHLTYDPLAGYLIAEVLLENYILSYSQQSLSSKQFVIPKEDVDRLFNKEYSKLHPFAQDISKSLALLMPKKMNMHLYEVTKSDGALTLSVDAFFELSADQINDKEIQFTERLFGKRSNRYYLFESSQKAIPITDHPFNAKFWSKTLKSLSMAERDLSWTEFVRENSSLFENYISEFERASKMTSLSSIEEERLDLVAMYLMWVLTSSNRNLRDLVTRALYFYGRSFPLKFADLVYSSLETNDPYIWERMLCALYGVTMAKEYDFNNNTFVTVVLPKIARKIYELMFERNAPYSTTHILARDYARLVIEIALKHHGTLLNKTERKRITPPFNDGGIRDWKEIDGDSIEKKEVYGGPIRMDFSNYTIGRIVKSGHSYSNPPEKVKVRNQIYWRIYDLGYDTKEFKETERILGNSNYQLISRSDRAIVERYGKKYSWIAFYEVAGYRQDKGLLEDEWGEPRISDAGIDPCFPESLVTYKLVHESFLGNKKTKTLEWIKNGGSPDLKKYLVVDGLSNNHGQWVCIDGFVNEKNKEMDKARFTFIRGLIIKGKDYNNLLKLLNKQNMGGRWLPEIAQNYYVYAGEMVNFPKFTYNNWKALSFLIREKKVKIKKGEPGYYPLFNKDDYKFSIKYPKEITVNKGIYKKYKVLLPVMEYYKGSHDELNNAGGVEIPSKEIIQDLGLVYQPQTFDLYEKNGKRASFSFKYWEGYENSQHFTFMRKDLFDRFLSDNDFKYVWVAWGEREIAKFNDNTYKDFYQKYKIEPRRVFQEIITYKV
jgi:hypothetical protein